MPFNYSIDVARRVIISDASGEVAASELLDHQNRLMRDPDFDPTFSQIADFSAVTRVYVESEDIRNLATRNFFAPGARRCFVAPTSEIFGLARMFQLFREVSGGKEELRVFRNRKEAILWLFGDKADSA
jgi:hypothetical protein